METTTAEEKAFVAGLAKKARGKRAGKSKAKAKGKASKSAKSTDSKKDIVLALLRRKEGTTIADMATATGWQNHSVRGFLSAQVGKNMGLKVESEKNEAGERVYRIA